MPSSSCAAPLRRLRKRALDWTGLSPCLGLAYLPAQNWPVFLLRKRVPDWTGLSPCSGTGSPTRLACLSAQEEGLELDWPPYSRRGTWTLQAPLLRCLSAFWGLYKYKYIQNHIKINISITCWGQSDTCTSQSYRKHKTSMGEHSYLSNQKILLGAH